MVNVSLPTGNFYAKELETNENYVVSEKEYAIAAKPENNVDQLFRIDVETIVNEAKKVTKFTLVKVKILELKLLNQTINLYLEL